MAIAMKCPGQDTRFWNFNDIFEVDCGNCHRTTEFFKDDPFRTCEHCGMTIPNPRLDLGCRAHCAQADQCRKERQVDPSKDRLGHPSGND